MARLRCSVQVPGIEAERLIGAIPIPVEGLAASPPPTTGDLGETQAPVDVEIGLASTGYLVIRVVAWAFLKRRPEESAAARTCSAWRCTRRG